MSRKNELAYDLIEKDFSLSRESSVVDQEVTQFASYLKKGAEVLSVGCGTGLPNERYLAQRFEITGIDISAKLLIQAKKNTPNGRFIQEDVMKFDTEESFSGILAWWSLFHLEPAEHEVAFLKLHQLLEDGGYLLFNHGGEEGEIRGEMFGEEFYYSCPGPEKIREMLVKLGFKILEWEVVKSGGNNHMVGLVQKTII